MNCLNTWHLLQVEQKAVDDEGEDAEKASFINAILKVVACILTHSCSGSGVQPGHSRALKAAATKAMCPARVLCTRPATFLLARHTFACPSLSSLYDCALQLNGCSLAGCAHLQGCTPRICCFNFCRCCMAKRLSRQRT